MTLALALFALASLTLIGALVVRRAKGIPGAMAIAFPSPHPYRPKPEPALEHEHAPDCVACAQLKERGRYQPPEILLASGFPLTCVSIVTNISAPDLERLAKSAGLVRVQPDGITTELATDGEGNG